MLSNKILKKIKNWLFTVKDLNPEIDSMHIDDIDKFYRENPDQWLNGAIEMLQLTYKIRKDLNLAHKFFLVIYLKDKRKISDLDFLYKNSLQKELHESTPPEIFLWRFNSWGAQPSLYLPIDDSLFPSGVKACLYDEFNPDDRLYIRTLVLTLENTNFFKNTLYNTKDLKLPVAESQLPKYYH